MRIDGLRVSQVRYECYCAPRARIKIKGTPNWLPSSPADFYLVAICRRDISFRGYPAETHGNRPPGRWRLSGGLPGRRVPLRNARSKNWQQFRLFMSDSNLCAMGIIFREICVLVTAAFALTLVPGFR